MLATHRPIAAAFALLATVCAALTLAAAGNDPNNVTGSTGLIMIDKRGNLVRFFDPATLKETGTLEIGGPPHELAISPDRRTACASTTRARCTQRAI